MGMCQWENSKRRKVIRLLELYCERLISIQNECSIVAHNPRDLSHRLQRRRWCVEKRECGVVWLGTQCSSTVQSILSPICCCWVMKEGQRLGDCRDASMQLRAVSVNMHFPYNESKRTAGITTALAYPAPFHPIWQCHNTLIPLVWLWALLCFIVEYHSFLIIMRK